MRSGSDRPCCLHEDLSEYRNKASWLPDGRTLAMNDNDNSRVLLVDTRHPHPARKRARALTTPGDRA